MKHPDRLGAKMWDSNLEKASRVVGNFPEQRALSLDALGDLLIKQSIGKHTDWSEGKRRRSCLGMQSRNYCETL